MKKLSFLVLFVPMLAFGQSKKMAITVDDLPVQLGRHDSVTLLLMNEEIVGHLMEAKAPAIGFVNEAKLYREGEVVDFKLKMLSLWADKGLELGNHTYSHLDYNNLTPAEFFKIIEDGEEHSKALMEKAGKEFTYFRHPFLHRGNTAEKVNLLEKYLKSRGYVEAPVTIDNSEWIFANAFDKAFREHDTGLMEQIGNSYVGYMVEKARHYERQSDKLFGRQIDQVLLIHANLLNSAYLGKLLQAYSEIGYRFASLEEVLKDPAYESKDSFVGNAGISWLDRWALTQGKKGDFFAGEPRCPKYVLDYTGLSE